MDNSPLIMAKALIDEAFQKIEGHKEISELHLQEYDDTYRINYAIRQRYDDKNYQTFFEEHKDVNAFPNISKMNQDLALVCKYLSYIKMSPAMSDTQKAIYEIDHGESSESDIDNIIAAKRILSANKNDVRLKAVFNFWKKKAKLLKDYYKQTQIVRRGMVFHSTHILTGKPGVGKTALLNYVFSVYAKELLEERVMWIRVDLNDALEGKKRLSHRFSRKFIQIFCRYYYNVEGKKCSWQLSPEDIRLYKIFFAEVNDARKILNKKELEILSVDNFIDKIDEYMVNSKTINISVFDYFDRYEQKYVPTYANILLEFLQKNYDYSYIFIFDGLDSVTLDKVQYKEYENWLTQIIRLADNRTRTQRFKGLYLISMRDVSLINYKKNVMDRADSDQEIHSILRVESKSLYRILNRRFRYIESELKKQAVTTSMPQLWNVKNNLLDIINVCLYDVSIEGFCEKYVKATITREDYNLLNYVSNNNTRALMRFFTHVIQILQSTWHENSFFYLSSSPGYDSCLKYLEGKEWTIHRILLFGDCCSGTYCNRYEYDSMGEMTVKSHYMSLVPNIFNYRDAGLGDRPTSVPRLLLKYRVIQLVGAQMDKRINLSLLLNMLSKVYGCSVDILRDDIREMIYTGLLQPKIDQRTFLEADINEGNYEVELTKLSEKAIPKIVKQAIYYEVIVDNTPIHRSIAGYIRPAHRQDKTIFLNEYLMIKSKSIAAFVFYLRYIERVDIDRWHSMYPCCNESGIIAIFTKNVIKAIKASMRYSLYGHLLEKIGRAHV